MTPRLYRRAVHDKSLKCSQGALRVIGLVQQAFTQNCFRIYLKGTHLSIVRYPFLGSRMSWMQGWKALADKLGLCSFHNKLEQCKMRATCPVNGRSPVFGVESSCARWTSKSHKVSLWTDLSHLHKPHILLGTGCPISPRNALPLLKECSISALTRSKLFLKKFFNLASYTIITPRMHLCRISCIFCIL